MIYSRLVMKMARGVVMLGLVVASSAGSPACCGQAAVASPLLTSKLSFNGDQYPDLLIGTPHETVSSLFAGGIFHTVLGGVAYPVAGSRAYTQGGSINNFAIVGEPVDAGGFGQALAMGDFDGDGFADAAVAAYRGTGNTAGFVHIFYGSVGGLTADRDAQLTQSSAGNSGSSSLNRFANALATGDFDNDGYEDLAVSAMNFAPGVQTSAIYIFYGAASGLNSGRAAQWKVHNVGDGRYGFALISGDFDGDHFADLAIGAPEEHAKDGNVYIYAGSSSGLNLTNTLILNQDVTLDGIPAEGARGAAAKFGYSLASGDFDRDGKDDLAVGVIEDTTASIAGGAIQLFYGTPQGLRTGRNKRLLQGPNIGFGSLGEEVESQDYFGTTLCTGDFDGDGYADLAVGTPAEGVITSNTLADNAGAIVVLRGSPAGITATGRLNVTLNDPSGSNAATGDGFGQALAASDLDGDGFDELIVAAPGRAVSSTNVIKPISLARAGAVFIFSGSSSGPTTTSYTRLTQGQPRIGDKPDVNNDFGFSLAAKSRLRGPTPSRTFLPSVMK